MFPVCRKYPPILLSGRTLHHVTLLNQGSICSLFSLLGHVPVKLSIPYRFLCTKTWIQMLTGSWPEMRDLRRRQTKPKWWIGFVRSTSIQITWRFVAERKFWEILTQNFWVEPNFRKNSAFKIEIFNLEKTILMLVILSNLPYCSHRGSFLPIWSFWLFWNWCWWWALFVFSDIFESDHQTVSIRTIEILKNNLTFSLRLWSSWWCSTLCSAWCSKAK